MTYRNCSNCGDIILEHEDLCRHCKKQCGLVLRHEDGIEPLRQYCDQLQAENQRLREALADIEQRLYTAILDPQTYRGLKTEVVAIQVDAQKALKGGDDAD